MADSLAAKCGQLLVVGLEGPALSPDEKGLLARGERGGVVLFRRNLDPAASIERLVALNAEIRAAAPSAPLVAIDQEGGRVMRIGPPALPLPAMRRIGDLGDLDFATRLAEAQARELAALGLTMSFAPVADIHTRPENPIIGDRAFGETPEVVARFAAAWARGLARGGILSCAKHFPGHGDTTVDSHLALPEVHRDREDLERTEIATFRALAREPDVHAMMTAHVMYPALDADRMATLSPVICRDMLRTTLGFEGVLFSDDLEMKALELPASEAAVLAVAAGCDVLLVCSRAELAAEAHAALVREAESSPAFRARCDEALARFTRMRTLLAPAAARDGASARDVLGGSAAIVQELALRLGAQPSAGARP